MKTIHPILLILGLLFVFSCKQTIEKNETNYGYYDKPNADTVSKGFLTVITDEDDLQFGARVAYVGEKGDTVIPFGKYRYLGTDTFRHYANILISPRDSSHEGAVAIDRNQNVLYDIVTFDNGPDYFSEGLVRASRNGNMGFANQYGQVVIPCEYDQVWWFKNEKAQVTYKAIRYYDMADHIMIDSDEWFYIDKKGRKIE